MAYENICCIQNIVELLLLYKSLTMFPHSYTYNPGVGNPSFI